MDNQPLYDAAQAQQFFHTLLRTIPNSVCLFFDTDLRYVEVQGQAPEVMGLSREALLGRTVREALPAETADLLEPLYREALAGNEQLFNLSLGERTYEVRVVPVRDGAGAISAGMVLASDITLQRQISSQARRYETIVENAPDAVLVYDLEGKIVYANPGAATILGAATRAELLGTDGRTWIDPEDTPTIDEALATLMSEGIWRGRVGLVGPAGKRVQSENVSFVLTDERGTPTGTATMARDITNQIREEEERAEEQRQIIDSQQATLRELSTPLIPLADNVVVMPLVGTIDSRRAGQIMETLLEGVAANQADIALLDISGVRVVDTQVADALLRAAKAAKLLGTRIVLTGIKAEVAQTIVHLGADMSEIVTRSNLQEGLRYALTEGGSDMVAGLQTR